jgi:hypothetical protein
MRRNHGAPASMCEVGKSGNELDSELNYLKEFE